jgi:hypothetical protein
MERNKEIEILLHELVLDISAVTKSVLRKEVIDVARILAVKTKEVEKYLEELDMINTNCYQHAESGKIVGPYKIGSPEDIFYSKNPKLWVLQKY